MEPDKLMIGNLLHDQKERLCWVKEINGEEFKAHAIRGGITSLPNKPIKITEVILKNMFKLREEGKRFQTTNFSGLYLEFGFQWYLKRSTDKGDILLHAGVEYVHELQNLFTLLQGHDGYYTYNPKTK